MNKVHIKISITKNDELTFYHCHSFSNLYIEDESAKTLLLDYLSKLDDLINPKHGFLSVFEVLLSTAFVDGSSFLKFKNFKKDSFTVNVSIDIDD